MKILVAFCIDEKNTLASAKVPFYTVLSISFLLCCPSSPFFFITSLHQEVSCSPNTPLGFCRFSSPMSANSTGSQSPRILCSSLIHYLLNHCFFIFFSLRMKNLQLSHDISSKSNVFETWSLYSIHFIMFFWSSWSYCKYWVNPLLQHVSGRDSTTSPYFHLHRFPLNKFPNALGNISIFLASLQDNCTYDDRCNFSNLDMKELWSEFHICLLDIQNSKFYLIRQHRTITSQTQDWSFFKIYFLWTCSSISCPYN